MRRKTFFYYTLLPNGNFCYDAVSQPLPTYPQSMRFKSYEDVLYYREARNQFYQSTKIPASCEKCPIDSLCGGYHQTIICRKLWRKIWEYVK